MLSAFKAANPGGSQRWNSRICMGMHVRLVNQVLSRTQQTLLLGSITSLIQNSQYGFGVARLAGCGGERSQVSEGGRALVDQSSACSCPAQLTEGVGQHDWNDTDLYCRVEQS